MIEIFVRLKLATIVGLSLLLLAIAQHHHSTVDESLGGRIGAGLVGGSALIGALVVAVLGIPLLVAITRKTISERLGWANTAAMICAIPSGLATLIMPRPLVYLAALVFAFDLGLALASSYAGRRCKLTPEQS